MAKLLYKKNPVFYSYTPGLPFPPPLPPIPKRCNHINTPDGAKINLIISNWDETYT